MNPYDQGQSVVFAAAGLEKTGQGALARGAQWMGESAQALMGMPKAISKRIDAGRTAREGQEAATALANKPAPPAPKPAAAKTGPAPKVKAAPQQGPVPAPNAPVLGQRNTGANLQVQPKPTGPAPRTSAPPGAHKADTTRQAANEELSHQAWQAAPAAATLAIGTAGTGYAMSPSNTPQNRARGASNRYLGTNFNQQSRAGAFFGS